MNGISLTSHQPIYYQLKQIIIEAIQSGEYKANDRLPTEKELCETYGISKAPVRQALQELEDENYIYKIHGKGSLSFPVTSNPRPRNCVASAMKSDP